ncbi:MAG: PAS domain S-box protein, partial [Desulfovermiculus sp.]
MSSKLRSKRPGENFLFDAVTELIATLDLDLHIQWANRAAADSVNTAPEALVGHHCYQVWHGRQSPCENCPVQRTIQTGEAHKNEVTTPDGKHWLIRSYPLFSPEGNLESVAELTLEITESKRTEKELRKSSNLLNKTQEIAQVGSWEFDLVANSLTWSNEAYRIFGLEPQKSPVTYKDFLERVHPDDRTKVDAAYTSSLKDGRDSYEVDHRIIRADTGEIRYVHERCFHERDSEGNVPRSVGMVQDITRRKTAEEDLRLSEKNLSQTLHSIGDAVISTDRMGGIVRMNPVAESLTGWSFEEAQGKPLTKVFKIINAFTREPCTDPVQMVLSSGDVQDLANHTVLLAQDGREYQIADSASPIRDDQGQISGVVLVFRDVTEKYRQQEVLQESKDRLDFALQATNTGLWDWNLQTGEAFFTEQWAAMAGYSLDELRPLSVQTWMDLCNPDDLSHSQTLLDKHFKNEIDSYECEARMWHKEGYWIWILDRGKVIEWDESGDPLRMIGTHTDITARKQAEEALQERKNRYRVLFEQSPISLWEEDFSGVKQRIQELEAQGVKDLQAYLQANPEEADYLVRQVKIIDVNQATLDLYQAKSKKSFFQGLSEIFEQESLEHFVNSLQHVFSERSSFSDEKIHRTFDGERINVQLFWSKVPGYEES